MIEPCRLFFFVRLCINRSGDDENAYLGSADCKRVSIAQKIESTVVHGSLKIDYSCEQSVSDGTSTAFRKSAIGFLCYSTTGMHPVWLACDVF